MRIGSAETDEQLQIALAKFLTPVILKLNSGDESIRKKVLLKNLTAGFFKAGISNINMKKVLSSYCYNNCNNTDIKQAWKV